MYLSGQIRQTFVFGGIVVGWWFFSLEGIKLTVIRDSGSYVKNAVFLMQCFYVKNGISTPHAFYNFGSV